MTYQCCVTGSGQGAQGMLFLPQTQPDIPASENLVRRVSDFLLSIWPRRRPQDALQSWHYSCCPCTLLRSQESCPTGGKNLSPQGPITPRNNGVQGSTHSVKARAGPGEPEVLAQVSSTTTTHICAHTCTPLALSSPSSALSQYLRALVPAVPALCPAHKHTQTQG